MMAAMLRLTWLTLPLLSLTLAGCASTQRHADTLPPRAQVLVLGTYHMHNPGADYANPEVDDINSPQRQREVEALVERLAAFAPTKIAVEYTPEAEPKLNETYTQYLQGKHTLDRIEIEQVAFRLARRMGHTRLHGVDSLGPEAALDIGAVLQSGVEQGQAEQVLRTQQIATAAAQRVNEHMKTSDVTGIHRFLNSPEFDSQLHGFYLRLTSIGSSSQPAGAELVTRWYQRNLKIFGNVLRLASSPEERILILFGAGHGKLLRQFTAESPDLQLVPASTYLQ